MTAMEAFHARVPQIGMYEYRSITALGIEGLPPAEYGFMELYCNDPSCDCRRVLFAVFAPEISGEFLATINYGWESREFYQKRFPFLSAEDTPCEAHLEPFGDQSEYSGVLLDCCKRLLLSDQEYIERLKRHYSLFRKALSDAPKSNTKPPAVKKGRKRPNRKRKRR